MKLTDEQIIKTLEEYLQKSQNIKYGARQKILVDADFLKEVLDLNNRQKAEIERLENSLSTFKSCYESLTDMYENAKSEAIKEFAERLKEKQQSVKARFGFGGEYISNGVMCTDIDNLVKEMVGDTE